MFASSFILIGGAAWVHVVAGRYASSPWWVPDITLVAMASAVFRDPQHSVRALVSGMLWATALTQSPWPAASAYGLAGVVLWQSAVRLDVSAPYHAAMMVGVAECVCSAVLIALGPVTSAAVLVWLGVRLIATVLMVPLVQCLARIGGPA